MKNTFYLLVGLVVLLGSVYFFLQSPAPADKVSVEEPMVTEEELNEDEKVLLIRNSAVRVEVADTPEERKQGLSGRESLEQGRGLLFIFDNVSKHGIWMKDMNFSIDIVWLDEEMRIVWIEKGVSPDTYPKVFSPTEHSKYVLELPAGAADEYSAQIGDIFTLKT